MEQIEFNDLEPEVAAPNEPHLACVLLLDTSGSMRSSIDDLNDAINRFKDSVSMDELSKKRVDIAIVEFNTTARVVQPFTPICKMEPITLKASGQTAMGSGINLAIDLVKDRNKFYNNMGTPCFKPWIFMMSDGAPYGEPDSVMDMARQRIKEEESKGEHGKLKFFALGVPGYDKDVLFSLTNRVMELREAKFEGIFNWLSQSMVSISVSQVGNEARLPMLPDDARKADRDVSDW